MDNIQKTVLGILGASAFLGVIVPEATETMVGTNNPSLPKQPAQKISEENNPVYQDDEFSDDNSDFDEEEDWDDEDESGDEGDDDKTDKDDESLDDDDSWPDRGENEPTNRQRGVLTVSDFADGDEPEPVSNEPQPPSTIVR